MSACDPAAVVIAHVSDLHMGAHDPAAVDGLAADVAAARPALTVVTGDLTMRARTGQFRRARALLDLLPQPRLVVLGNHDVPLLAAGRLLWPYRRYRACIQPELDPWIDIAGARALGLQSMPRWRWKGGRISRRQAGLVVEVLGAAPAPALRLLALHHPPCGRGLRSIVGRDALARALRRARVDLVLAGHTHVPAARRVDLPGEPEVHRLVEVVAGTATSRRTRGAGRSWTVIRADRRTITVRERHEAAGVWHAGPVAVFGRRG